MFDQIDEAAGVAVGKIHDAAAGGRLHARRIRLRQRAFQQRVQGVVIEGFQRVDLRAREQGGVDFKRGVFRGGADEGNQPLFDEGQKGVLLRFVETVDFVDKQDGAPRGGAVGAGAFDGFTNILDAGKHRRQGDEIGLKSVGKQTGERGFADPGRPPENQRMRLPAGKGQRQRFAGGEQVALTGDFFQTARAQTFGQRRIGRDGVGRALRRARCGRDVAEEILSHWRRRRGWGRRR